MHYAVVYDSHTGNTELLAKAIQEALPPSECLYFGPPSETALVADTLYIGFWTDKGSCSPLLSAFLPTLTHQRVFLFGTAGFGGSPEYFSEILSRVKSQLPSDCRLMGSFMCQGRMPMAVRKRYEAMEPSPKRDELLENFDRALLHPSEEDLAALRSTMK